MILFKYCQDATICFRKGGKLYETTGTITSVDVGFSSETSNKVSTDSVRGCVAVPVQLDNLSSNR